jgi:hypothetical protein
VRLRNALDVAIIMDGLTVLIGVQLHREIDWLAANFAGHFRERETTHSASSDGHNERRGKEARVLSTIDQWPPALLYVRYRRWAAMLSPEEMAQIKAEIRRLEQLREECTDSGIRKRIEAWIEAEKKKLAK